MKPIKTKYNGHTLTLIIGIGGKVKLDPDDEDFLLYMKNNKMRGLYRSYLEFVNSGRKAREMAGPT